MMVRELQLVHLRPAHDIRDEIENELAVLPKCPTPILKRCAPEDDHRLGQQLLRHRTTRPRHEARLRERPAPQPDERGDAERTSPRVAVLQRGPAYGQLLAVVLLAD